MRDAHPLSQALRQPQCLQAADQRLGRHRRPAASQPHRTEPGQQPADGSRLPPPAARPGRMARRAARRITDVSQPRPAGPKSPTADPLRPAPTSTISPSADATRDHDPLSAHAISRRDRGHGRPPPRPAGRSARPTGRAVGVEQQPSIPFRDRLTGSRPGHPAGCRDTSSFSLSLPLRPGRRSRGEHRRRVPAAWPHQAISSGSSRASTRPLGGPGPSEPWSIQASAVRSATVTQPGS